MIDVLSVDSSILHSIIETSPTLTFSLDNAATDVTLNFGPTEVDSLLGSHTLTLTVTMLDFPLMDYFTEQIRTINLIITSACETTSILRENPAI